MFDFDAKLIKLYTKKRIIAAHKFTKRPGWSKSKMISTFAQPT